jgi:hypothetical protein
VGKWEQVSGDMSFDSHGCVIAKTNKRSRSVDHVKIEPWLGLDSSALKEGYGFWDVQETTIDYESMSVKHKDVLDAIKSTGMSTLEYKKLDPAHKAVIVTEDSGFDGNSRSTNDFADALPVDINDIAWWSNGPHDVKAINQEMRYEVTRKLHGGDYRDEVPDDEALELAMGDEEVIADLNEDEAQAVRYAQAVTTRAYTWTAIKDLPKNIKVANIDEMKVLLSALFSAPKASDLPSDGLEKVIVTYQRSFDLDWEDKREQAIYMIDEDAELAHSVGNTIIQQLGL